MTAARARTRRAKRAGIKRGEDVGFDLQAAATGVDEDRAAERAVPLQLREERRVDDPASGFSQRQQHDQHVGLRQEALQALSARKADDTGQRLWACAPAGDLKA